MTSNVRLLVVLSALSLVPLVGAANADRLVLAPRALITIPGTAKAEFLGRMSGRANNVAWLNAGLPGSLNGYEVEIERFELGGVRRVTGSIQYSFTGNAFLDVAPAFSVGIRDVANNGREGRSLFAAATKSIPLSLAQERFIRQLQVDVGYGTSRLGGPYAGIQGRLPFGPIVSAEIVARRFNAAVTVPLMRRLNLKAASLNGTGYYGATLFLVQ